MNMLISFALFFLLFFGGKVAVSQEIDKERMNKDLKVAEAILGSLTRPSSGKGFQAYFPSQKRSARYLEGYGVILNVHLNTDFAAVSELTGRKSQERVVMPGLVEADAGSVTKAKPDSAQQRKSVASALSRTQSLTGNLESDSAIGTRVNQSVEMLKTFLIDYGDLIGQLKSTDKIRVMEDKVAYFQTYNRIRSDASGSSGIAVEVLKGDLEAIKTGKYRGNSCPNGLRSLRRQQKYLLNRMLCHWGVYLSGCTVRICPTRIFC